MTHEPEGENGVMIPSIWQIRWPRFALYPPLMMGFIQPEWLFLYQIICEARKEQVLQSQVSPTTTVKTPIRIHFHARPETLDKKRETIPI
jgi:hypothetical protein